MSIERMRDTQNSRPGVRVAVSYWHLLSLDYTHNTHMAEEGKSKHEGHTISPPNPAPKQQSAWKLRAFGYKCLSVEFSLCHIL